MSRFNLNKAPVGGGAPSTKLPQGSYLVRVEKCFVKDSDNKRAKTGPYFICEFTVLDVFEGGNVFTDVHGNYFPATKKGDYRSWANDMSHPGGPGTLNEFLAAVDGVDPKDPDALKEANLDFDKLCDDAIDDDNPMRGATVKVTVSLKKSGQNKQNDFMLNQFAVDDTEEAAA